ncbi:MAG TPA: O-antigen ligase family protein [Thermoanaerobaculia bacterium]|nr:O-antigen ligase family protein [Thermoanaerobaculia bacterium]
MALTALLAALLLWAPLPFAGVVSWADTSLEIVAFGALALAMAAIDRPADLRHVAIPAAALAGMALLGALQALSWSPRLVSLLSPAHGRLYREAAALQGEVELAGAPELARLPADPTGAPAVAQGSAAAQQPPAAARLTVAPAATASASLAWAAAASSLLAGAAAGRRRLRRRWLGGAVLLGAIAQVFLGARAANAGERTLWGVEVPIAASRLRGTFFNPNHLAMYLEIALALSFAWGWWALRRARLETTYERRALAIIPPVLVWLTLFSGLAFTASRGGLVAALAGILAQGALLATARRRWAPAFLGAAAAVAGVAAAVAMGLQAGPARALATQVFDVSLQARREAWGATLGLWRMFPLTGSGLGTFRDAFPMVQPARLDGTWWHAHSAPLELLATAGPAGAVLALAGMAGLAVRLFVVLRRGRRTEDRAAGLAVLGALIAVTVHECFDFGLTLPANALTLATMAGAACSVRLAASPVAGGQANGAGKAGPARQALELEQVRTGRHRGGERKQRP